MWIMVNNRFPYLVCMGIEPTTFGLQDQRSANWANKPAYRQLIVYLRVFIAACSLLQATKIIFKIDYNIIARFYKPLVHVGN